ncbi:fumarylacetoacetate hydrolase family protein [Microbacterium sp.]|uniref:fumarylacetoacetate hydrolase family protein n=1 Tax=Microbacterium sp. TaxID=51671 RepID=UPI003A8E760C
MDLGADYPTTESVYGDWDRVFDDLVARWSKAASTGREWREYRVLPPVERPQLFCAGSNYRQHAAEMYTHNQGEYQKARRPGESDEAFFQRNLAFVQDKRATGMPFIWLSSHGGLVGPHDDIQIPAVGSDHDWEAELTVVIAGGSPRYMTPDEAGEYIAGYTIGDDMHTGDLYSRSDIKWNADWIAKQQPTFHQAGPFVVPRQFFPDLTAMRITLDVSGERMQDWPADDMIFSTEQYLSYASERLLLLPGDLLMMGSPPGNGAVHGGRWLTPGDTVDIAITGLGAQHHRVIAEETHGRIPYWGMPPYDPNPSR